MPDRDEPHDPMDEAYLHAEQALDDEAARAARRAKVLAAAQQDATAPAPASVARRPFRRYGGWLAAACVAGLSVVTAEQVYRLAPRNQPGAPPPVEPTAPTVAKAPEPPSAPPPVARVPRRYPPPPPPVIWLRQAPSVQAAPASPSAEIAPPPPLPIPPVEKPLASIATPPAFAEAQPRAADSQSKVEESVVVTSRRQGRTSAAALALAAPKALDAAASLRVAASAGRSPDIENLLAQGVPVDAPDEAGETALMKAVEAGQRDAAALLRRHGASLDLKNRAGVSARDLADRKGDPELDKALGLTP
jgi:hypothetical protein